MNTKETSFLDSMQWETLDSLYLRAAREQDEIGLHNF